MKKKVLLVLLCGCLSMSILTACGNGQETAMEEVIESTVEETVEPTTEEATEPVVGEVVEETTEVVEETVVEEQTTETTETVVEEIVVEETTEDVAEEATVAFLDESIDWPEGYPKVFINDDPRTSEVADMASILGISDYYMYMWKTEDSPMISIYETTERFDTYQEAISLGIEGVESFTTVSTVDGEKEVLLLTDEENTNTVYTYTLGDYTIEINDVVGAIGATYDLQHIVDLIRFE